MTDVQGFRLQPIVGLDPCTAWTINHIYFLGINLLVNFWSYSG